MVPEGALVLPNPNGTAPGLAMQAKPHQWLVMLPGPPRELRPMFTDAVVPLLHRELPLGKQFVCRTLRTVGIGESQVAVEQLAKITQMNSALVDESAAASAELSQQAEALEDAVTVLMG